MKYVCQTCEAVLEFEEIATHTHGFFVELEA